MSDPKITSDQALCERLSIAALEVEDERVRLTLYALDMCIRTGDETNLNELASRARTALREHHDGRVRRREEPDYLTPRTESQEADHAFDYADRLVKTVEAELGKMPEERDLRELLATFAVAVRRWKNVEINPVAMTEALAKKAGKLTGYDIIRAALESGGVPRVEIRESVKARQKRERGKL